MNKKLLKFGRKLSPYKSRGLGVFYSDKKFYLFYSAPPTKKEAFQVDRSPDGLDFSLYEDSAEIKIKGRKKENIKNCRDFRVAEAEGIYFLTYKVISKNQPCLCGAISSDLISWERTGMIARPAEAGMLVPNFKYKDNFVLYFGEKSAIVGKSLDLKTWKVLGGPVTQLTGGRENLRMKIGSLAVTEEGILMIYYQFKRRAVLSEGFRLKAALFDKENPVKLLWDKVVWEGTSQWKKKGISTIGTLLIGNKLISYWQDGRGQVFALHFPYFRTILQEIKPVFISPIINKFKNNPILAPIIHHLWESKAVFNPTAFYDEGKVHIVYRAVGDNDVSTLGYASSKDGVTIEKRRKHPIYVPTQPFEGSEYMARSHRLQVKKYKRLANSPYVSGPGIGGCEDPRMTKLEGRVYITYAAFNGYEQARSAFTSISAEDFQNERWNWAKPTLMTAKPTVWGTGSKNACFLSEKINGKYVIMHRFWPNILIDYVDSLDFGEGKKFLRTGKLIPLPEDMWEKGRFSIGGAVPLETDSGWLVIYGTRTSSTETRYDIGIRLLDKGNTKKILADYINIDNPNAVEFLENEGIITPRAHMWDSAKIGIGAPPIKIDEGWLLIYQSVGYHDSSRYKAGAMLLDIDNPAKVLHRSSRPILEPNERYENEGHKAGIVYPCGAVIKEKELFVYYGGADTVACVGHANIDEFLDQLKGSGSATLQTAGAQAD